MCLGSRRVLRMARFLGRRQGFRPAHSKLAGRGRSRMPPVRTPVTSVSAQRFLRLAFFLAALLSLLLLVEQEGFGVEFANVASAFCISRWAASASASAAARNLFFSFTSERSAHVWAPRVLSLEWALHRGRRMKRSRLLELVPHTMMPCIRSRENALHRRRQVRMT